MKTIQRARAGVHTVVVAGTASGKTLCYNLPVLSAILRDPSARALYLFPTKALAQDQLSELQGLAQIVHQRLEAARRVVVHIGRQLGRTRCARIGLLEQRQCLGDAGMD